METKIKWNKGDGYITASYDGSGDGAVVVTSDVNNGDERQQYILVETEDKSISIPVFVAQKGRGVVETYTRLTYIEATGKQYINLGYIVEEDDVIEIYYAPTMLESGRLFGTIDSVGNSIYFSFSSKNAFARFGNSKPTIITNGIQSNWAMLKKGSVSINTFSASMPYIAMPNTPLYLFACFDSDEITGYSYYRCMGFTISKANGQKIELLPFMRNSDGEVGLLDVKSLNFYTNEGEDDFTPGSSYTLPEGYSSIDGVSFNGDILFDLCKITQDDTIDIMYQRSDTSESQYLYGITNNGNTASVTAYLASNGAWRFGNQLVRPNVADRNVHRTRIANASSYHDCSDMTMNKSIDFETADTVVVGGYRDAEGMVFPQYKGKVYYVRINNGKTLDWIPCQRLSDEVEGFWDCVEQRFIEPI